MKRRKYVYEATGRAVSGYEDDYFEVSGADGATESVGITDLLAMVGAEVINWSEAHAFDREGDDPDNAIYARVRKEYRCRTGRQRPKDPVRVRITVEVLGEDEE